MTKRTKYILLAVSGLVLAGGALVVCVALIIGVIYFSAQTSEAKSDHAPVKIKKQRKKSDNPKIDSKTLKDNENEQISEDDEDRTASKNDSNENAQAEAEDTTIAPDLVGEWIKSEGSGQVDATGKTQYRSGAQFTYQFLPDGTVEYKYEKKVLSIIQCQIEETKTKTGKVVISDDTMTIKFGETDFTSSNSCEEADNFEKTLPAETIRLNWHLKTDEYDVTRLCLDETDGEACYDKRDE
jgi:hypothetical protein